MSYNGWSNYETWNVSLWLNNEPGTYDDLRRIANGSEPDYKRAARLKDYVNELMPWEALGASMAADLLGAALSEVDWLEVVTAARDEDDEDDEEQDAGASVEP